MEIDSFFKKKNRLYNVYMYVVEANVTSITITYLDLWFENQYSLHIRNGL